MNDHLKLERNKPLRYFIITHGCQMNERDSETLAGLLDGMGHLPAAREEEADLILINTCCVRQTAENKIYGKIGLLKRIKKRRPQLIVGICGCMMQQEGLAEKIMEENPHLDLLFGTHNIHRLPELLARVQEGEKVIEIWDQEGEIAEGLPARRQEGVKAYVNIMYGCNNFCSYCIVPYVRGRERSRKFEDIKAEIEELVSRGYKEIMLLGQNVNTYGKGLEPSIDFAELLTRLDKIEGLERIRYMTSHPRDFSFRTIEAIAASRHVCEHFHLPLQAGSNKVLEEMNRGYTREKYLELVNQIRAVCPKASITTDLIVGFPGETEKDFLDTMDMIEKVRFDAAFTFIYSPRPGTPAAEKEDTVPLEAKKERLKLLMQRQNQISREINAALLGQEAEILVEGKSKTNPRRLSGRTRTNKIVHFSGPESLIGQLVTVKILETKTWNLLGEIKEPQQA